MLLPQGILFFFVPLFFYICYTDIRYRLIYNNIVVFLFVLIIITALIYHTSINWRAFFSILIIGFLLFSAKAIGAGDIKLSAVLGLSVSSAHFMDWLVLIGLYGFCVVIIVLFCHYFLKIYEKTIPYGVAISLGYLTLPFL